MGQDVVDSCLVSSSWPCSACTLRRPVGTCRAGIGCVPDGGSAPLQLTALGVTNPQMHMHDWERMKRVVRPEECLMPQLAAMGASDQGQEQQEEATTNTGRKKQRAAN